jgi:hypothetical protein
MLIGSDLRGLMVVPAIHLQDQIRFEFDYSRGLITRDSVGP